MFKKVALALVLAASILATPTTASADNYSYDALNYTYTAYACAEVGEWYDAYYFAEYGAYYAYLDYYYSGDGYAYQAWQDAAEGSTYAYQAYLHGDPMDESTALNALSWAYFYAYERYEYGW
jgi:hypothetical protein